jgi:hypothetical protein
MVQTTVLAAVAWAVLVVVTAPWVQVLALAVLLLLNMETEYSNA